MTAVTLSPTATKERIQVIDILRGIALFGIILVNVHGISNSWYVTDINATTMDHIAQFITDALFLNKFYILFSFLFGLGFSFQMSRAKAKDVPFSRTYLRRLFWLLLFGLMHSIFIWDGDILMLYVMLGVFLIVI